MNPVAAQTPTPEYTRELVEFLHRLRPEDLPGEVLDRARYFLLDYLAVTVRGSREESAQCVQRMIQPVPTGLPTNCATVIGKIGRAHV